MKQCFVFVAGIVFCASTVFAQAQQSQSSAAASASSSSTSSASANGGNSSSSATGGNSKATGGQANNSNNTTVENVSKAAPSFVTALPGPASGIFPGFAPGHEQWEILWGAAEHDFSADRIKRMKGHGKIYAGRMVKEHSSRKDEDSQLTRYWADGLSHPEDKVLDHFTVIGELRWPIDGPLGLALERCAKEDSHRVSIRYTGINKAFTKTKSLGIGGVGSGVAMPESGNAAVGVAGGFGLGSSASWMEAFPELDVLCMNDGSVDPPAMPEQAKENNPAPAPAAPSLPQIIHVAIDPIHVVVDGALPVSSPAPVLTPAPQPAAEAKECRLDPWVILFDFDKSIIKNVDLPKIGQAKSWILNHSNCLIEVVGHTDKVGTTPYNYALGGRRATAVVTALINAGVPKNRITYTSAGKADPASEYPQAKNPENRRVILEVISSKSGK